eukprot:358760-Chlamydomonas_euryale.AAC.9
MQRVLVLVGSSGRRSRTLLRAGCGMPPYYRPSPTLLCPISVPSGALAGRGRSRADSTRRGAVDTHQLSRKYISYPTCGGGGRG